MKVLAMVSMPMRVVKEEEEEEEKEEGEDANMPDPYGNIEII